MIRFGIVGTNFITERMLEAVKELDDFTLAAVFSRTEEKAAKFAERYGVSEIFTSLEEMAKSDKIDAVYIASPNAYHAPQSILFLEHGKHVLCEKPLASNEKEVRAMIDAAKKGNALLMEAMKPTLLPSFASVKANLPKIGKVRRYVSSYCQYSSRYDAYRNGEVLNAFKPELSNGSLMDLGVYCLYPLIALLGEPQSVKANAVMLDSGVDGEGSILMGYDGFEAVIMYSKITDSKLPTEIQGEDGTIVIERISEMANPFIRYRDGSEERIAIEEEHPTMYYEMEEFIRLIKEGKTESSINTFETSAITLKVADQVRKQIGLEYPADRVE